MTATRTRFPASDEPVTLRAADLRELLVRGALEWGAPETTAETMAGDVSSALRRMHAEEVAAWPETPELPGAVDPEPLPLDAFPPVLADLTRSVAASVQVSPDVPALLALAAVSAAVAGKVEVRVDGAWTREWVALYGVLVADPAERKSPAFRVLTEPLREWEVERARAVAPRREVAMELLDVAERRLRSTKEAAAKGQARPEEVEDAIHGVREARASVPPMAALLAQDATPEALVQQMGEQGGRVAVLSPEGGPLRILDGRYSEGSARLEELAQGYDGEALHPRRIGRETRAVRRPALTLGVALQPSVLEAVRNGRSLRGQGIYGRICWVRPSSRMGARVDSSEVPPLDREAGRRYADALRHLLDWEAADVEDDGTLVPHVLELSGGAQDVKRAYHYEIEDALRPGGALAGISDWAGKTVGRAVRIAALLELAARAGDGRPPVGAPISKWAMESAVRLCRALTSHALAIYGEMAADRRTADLRYLLRRLQELPPGSTESDLRASAKGRASIEGAEDVADLVDELEALGCVRRVALDAPGGPGRPPSPRLELHPAIPHRHPINPEKPSDDIPSDGLRDLRDADAGGTPDPDPVTEALRNV